MPVILCILCLAWLVLTSTIQKGNVATGNLAQDRQSKGEEGFINSITDKTVESELNDYINNNLSAAWEEADKITKKLPTWEKVRSMGCDPRVSSCDMLTILMATRYGKLPRFEVRFPSFRPPFYRSEKRLTQFNPIMRDELVLAIEKELRERGHDVFMVIETQEYNGGKVSNSYYTLSKHILKNGERDEAIKKSPSYMWSGVLSPIARRKLDTGIPVYGNEFIGF